jgi:hypothetical protein
MCRRTLPDDRRAPTGDIRERVAWRAHGTQWRAAATLGSVSVRLRR